MAITAGPPVLLSPGTPTRRYLVPVILDGSATSVELEHGIDGAPGAPDRIAAALGGTSTVYISKCVANSASPESHVDLTVSGAGTNTHTLNLELEWLTAF